MFFKISIFLSILFSFFVRETSFAQTSKESFFNASPASHLLSQRWAAQWISCSGAPIHDYGVYHFRKTFELQFVPDSFIINISADNRYRLFVNGKSVCSGPARGDIAHWYFETVNISSYLRSGKNVIAAVVWNFGEFSPQAQISLQTGLIVQGNSSVEEIVNTDTSWKSFHNKAYSPSTEFLKLVGSPEIVDASLYPWDWEQTAYDDSRWNAVHSLGKGQPYGSGLDYQWVLYPRDIPLMEESTVRMKKIRRSEGLVVPDEFLNGKSLVTIQPQSKVSFLIDQTYLTNAYPEILLKGGKGSEIKLTYSEALFKNKKKGNRNETADREIIGYVDKYYPDGAADRVFRPLWFRTYRYIQVDIQTKNEPLTIRDMYGMFTAYPFKEIGSFESDLAYTKDIWNVGWRTARLCAHEIYFDGPYYEQMQYIGDTRIQALISLYVSGDDRLMKKAIRLFDWSRSYEGITRSRYPDKLTQYIPPYSLNWINMVHDYWMYREDDKFIKSFLPGIRNVLDWFSGKIDSQTGMLGTVPHWNFQDWTNKWPWNSEAPTGGVPPGGSAGGSSIYSLQLAYTLKDAIDLFEYFGEKESSARYRSIYNSLCKSTMKHCWDKQRQILWDDISKTSYSQHAGIMGILSEAVPQEKQKELFINLNTDKSFIQASYYYRFYLFQALKKVGLAEQYISMLQPWRGMINNGLTTFAENPGDARSDCHAWSAGPVYDFLATVCGVTPASPGFKTVNVSPHLGELNYIKGKIPHPLGVIEINLSKTGSGIKGVIKLPASLSGYFIWNGYRKALSGGENEVEMPLSHLF